MESKSKAPQMSRLVWVGVLTAAIGVAEKLVGVVPPEWTPWLLMGIGCAVVILRVLTNKPISLSKD